MFNCTKKLAAGLAAWLLVATPAFAEEDEGAHEYHRNLLGLFVGVTGEDRREKGLTLGVEYERRLSKSFGIGILGERVTGDIDAWVFAVPFAYHTGPWKLYAGPGLEDQDETSGSEFLVRVGVEYGFEVGRWEIAPQADLDFVDSDTVLIVGVTFGRGF